MAQMPIQSMSGRADPFTAVLPAAAPSQPRVALPLAVAFAGAGLVRLALGRDAGSRAACAASGLGLLVAALAILGFPADAPRGWRHVGMYAYRRDVLLRLASLAPTQLEEREKLEQLRALEHGIAIGVVEWTAPGALIEVDTPADLERARAAVRSTMAGDQTAGAATPAESGRA